MTWWPWLPYWPPCPTILRPCQPTTSRSWHRNSDGTGGQVVQRHICWLRLLILLADVISKRSSHLSLLKKPGSYLCQLWDVGITWRMLMAANYNPSNLDDFGGSYLAGSPAWYGLCTLNCTFTLAQPPYNKYIIYMIHSLRVRMLPYTVP